MVPTIRPRRALQFRNTLPHSSSCLLTLVTSLHSRRAIEKMVLGLLGQTRFLCPTLYARCCVIDFLFRFLH